MNHNVRSPILAVILLIFLGAVPGCGYGKISPKAYELATALHSIANRQDEKRLPIVADLVKTASEKKEISSQETGWLQDIISQCKNNNWSTATRMSRQMLKDQVSRSRQ